MIFKSTKEGNVLAFVNKLLSNHYSCFIKIQAVSKTTISINPVMCCSASFFVLVRFTTSNNKILKKMFLETI